jgi:flagellar hook-basal body complex protein FliE
MTLPAVGGINTALPVSLPTPATTPAPSTGSDFASVLGKGIDAVQNAQSAADNLALQAATGDLTNIHDYTIAATQAAVVTELAAAIRTKGVDAFNQIMGMQV